MRDPHLLHWVAERGGRVVGFMLCHVLLMRSNAPREVLLYEIGVRDEVRRTGVGRDLMKALAAWMRRSGVKECWVLADNPGAVRFYRACGFQVERPAPVYMVRPGAGPP